MHARVLASVIALAAIVAGCGSSRPATAASGVAGELAGVAFASSEGARQARTVAAARDRLARRCMAARGLSYRPAAPGPDVPIADALPSASGYGLGAQFARSATAARREPPRQSAAYRRALLGSPRAVETLRVPGGFTVTYRSRGCLAEALGTLYGGVGRYQRLVVDSNVLGRVAGERVAADLRLAGALAGWRRCMAASGFRYRSPDAARLAVHRAYLEASERAGVVGRERATASADRACAQRTALYAELARAQRDALRRLTGAERSAAAALARSRATALERARRIVGDRAGVRSCA